jgi:hypothetical protein
MWWRKTPQRAQPDWGFSEPEPPTGGEAYTDLLGEVGATEPPSHGRLGGFIIYIFYILLIKT